MARERSTLNNGHLNDATNGNASVDVTVLDDAAITPDRFPLWGQRSGQWNTIDGFTTAWAIPRETAAGEWAAPCRDPDDPAGQPEPAWPDPGPI